MDCVDGADTVSSEVLNTTLREQGSQSRLRAVGIRLGKA